MAPNRIPLPQKLWPSNNRLLDPVPSPHRAIAEENEENFKGIHLGKKRLLDRVARFGILSRDLGNIQGCWDFSREFFLGKQSRENSRDF